MKINNFAQATIGPAVMLLTLAAGVTTFSISAHAQSPKEIQAWADSQVDFANQAVESALNQVERMYGIDPRNTANMSTNARVTNLMRERMDQMSSDELQAWGERASGMTMIDRAQQQIRDGVQKSDAEIQRQNYVGHARSYRDYYDNAARYYASIGDGWSAQSAMNAANAWRAQVRQWNNGQD